MAMVRVSTKVQLPVQGLFVGDNDEELLIATNNHVVDGASTLSVCFIGNDVMNAGNGD